MDIEELELKIEEMKEIKNILDNIQEGSRIERFLFTDKEKNAIIFVIEMIETFIQTK